MKLASIDFEYYDTAEEKLKLVCAAIRYDGMTQGYWLHDDNSSEPYHTEEALKFRLKLQELKKEGYTLLAYNVIAEASSFISANLNPFDYKWIDLYLEYRCLSNHNDNYAYGKKLIKGRKRVTKRPVPKWERKTEEDEFKADSMKQDYGYGAAVYKTLGKVIDTDFKEDIRNLIIACNSGEQKDIDNMLERKDDILLYCKSDVEHLEPMLQEMLKEYKRLLKEDFNLTQLVQEMFWRSEYAVRSAKMERLGYPINVEQTRNFSDQVDNIIWECQHDINSQFEESFFRAKVKKRPFELSWNQLLTREVLGKWTKENRYKNWTLTKTGALSLSLKAFQKPISYRHDFPRGNFIAQMQRYLKLKQGLNGFVIKKGKKSFWDSVGRDGRVRPYMGIYGAQSARSQPSATGFIPLKSAWMRSLIQPNRGKAICGIDFASQEFLLAALLSGDDAMLRAYESGDVYLAFGKDIRYIPSNGTKETHKDLRDNCKAVVLGLSYDMSEYGLAYDLTEKFGRKVTPEEALTWINKHKKAYPKFWAWKEKLQRDYKRKGYIKLPDGWYMWGDNDNFRSVGNVPVQGLGSCIMRKAVQLAQDRGLDVIYTLHDAIYIEYDMGDTDNNVYPNTLARCMDEAFRYYFDDATKEKATVRLDADIWSPDFSDDISKYSTTYESPFGSYKLPCKLQRTYIDERSISDYKKFSKYFDKQDYESLEF